MKQTYLLPKILSVVFILLTTISCMRENDSDCRMRLSVCFSYTNNPEGKELFSEEVDEVYFYTFDSRGNFVYSNLIQASSLGTSRTIELDLDEGEYQFVAWGNLKSDYFDTSDNVTADSRAVIIKTDQNGETNGSTVDLFHGSATVNTKGKRQERVVVGMTKNTNTINVLLKSSNTRTVPETDFSVRIASDNGAINFDNSTASRPVTYKPNYSTGVYGDETFDVASFKVMQLRVGDNTKIQLYKEDALNTEESLTDLIREHLPYIQTNEDFDRYSEYTFVYEYDDTSGLFVLVGIGLEDWDAPERPGGI